MRDCCPLVRKGGMKDDSGLPIESIRDRLVAAVDRGAAVVTAPTGSGKSTQVPRWLSRRGRTLVIEPRRVACRALAQRVSELEGVELGERVGYAVRDDRRAGRETRLLFATPGVVVRWMAGGRRPDFDTVVLDELHERSLETDLLLALLADRYGGDLVAMSATLDGDRVARHLGGEHLRTEGHAYPVAIRHAPGNALQPDTRGLEDRLLEALAASRDASGDALVFLPGKAEIAKVSSRLTGSGHGTVLQMHGGLSLAEQSRVFAPSEKRRIVLATNVAETSITIPGIGVVLDSGLVRRTRYVNGRAVLSLVPVAGDSADQRAGRAGRTGPGVCYRLWGREAILERRTPPEIHRESLAPLLLAAAACDAEVEKLPFLDPPRDFALEDARRDLAELGALDRRGEITERGRRLFGLPLDPALGSLLVESERAGILETGIDLVAALSADRPLFRDERRPPDADDDLRESGCDAVALIRAVRQGEPGRHGLSRSALVEARASRRRLRKAFFLPSKPNEVRIDRSRIARAALRSDPRCAYVARRRRGRVFWSNGGTEIELGRQSAVREDEAEAIAVLGIAAVGVGYRQQRIFATCAVGLKLGDLAEARLGRERVRRAERKGDTAVALIECVYAGRVVDQREEEPAGELARQAIASLLLEGRLYPEEISAARERLADAALLSRLHRFGCVPDELVPDSNIRHDQDIEGWVEKRIEEIGVERGSDLQLLTPKDFEVPELPEHARQWLVREFPRSLSLGDAEYSIEYDLGAREATLVLLSGRRKEPPARVLLPGLPGFRVRARHHSKIWILKNP